MRLVIFLLLCSAALAQNNIAIGSVKQQSGVCGVNLAGVQGPLSITRNCLEIPPAAMKAINQLNAVVKDLREQAVKNQEAFKTYQEITRRLDSEGDSPQLQQVRSLTAAGKFAEAIAVLQPLTAAADKEAKNSADKAASHHYETAELHDLAGEPWKALPEYAEAFRLNPGDVTYSHGYAQSLLVEGKYDAAEKMWTQMLPSLRQLAASNPGQYQTTLGVTLLNLAATYVNLRQFDDARKTIDDSLTLLRNAPEGEAKVWDSIVEADLVKLAIYVVASDDDSDDQEDAIKKNTEDMLKLLLQHMDNKSAYGRLITAQLRLLEEKTPEAKKTLGDVLRMVRANPSPKDEVGRVLEANTLELLAWLYGEDDRSSDAEKARSDEAEIYRKLAALNARYRDPLAEALRSLASSQTELLTAPFAAGSIEELRKKQQEREKSLADPNGVLGRARASALRGYIESANLLSQLSVNEPDRYRRRLIADILERASFCQAAGLSKEAREAYEKALQLEKEGLQQGESELGKIQLANTELAAADFYRSVKDSDQAEKSAGQALDLFRSMTAKGSAAAANVLISELWKMGSAFSRAQDSASAVRTYTEAWALCQRFAGIVDAVHFETSVQLLFGDASRYYLAKHMDEEYDRLVKGLPRLALKMYLAIPGSNETFSLDALMQAGMHYRASKRPTDEALFLLVSADLVLQEASRYETDNGLFDSNAGSADTLLERFDSENLSDASQAEAIRYRAVLGDIRKCIPKCEASKIDRMRADRDAYLDTQVPLEPR